MNITTLSVDVFGQTCNIKIEETLLKDINECMHGSWGYAVLYNYTEKIEKALENFYYLKNMKDAGDPEGVKHYVETNYYLGYTCYASITPARGDHFLCDVDQFEPEDIGKTIQIFDWDQQKLVDTNMVSTHIVLWSHDS